MTPSLPERLLGCALTALFTELDRIDPSQKLLAGVWYYGCITVGATAMVVVPIVTWPLGVVDWVRGAE